MYFAYTKLRSNVPCMSLTQTQFAINTLESEKKKKRQKAQNKATTHSYIIKTVASKSC